METVHEPLSGVNQKSRVARRSACVSVLAHCHNLAHEDHAMMYGWEIT